MAAGGGGGASMIGGGGGGPGRHAQSRRLLPSFGVAPHDAATLEYVQMPLLLHMYGMPQLSACQLPSKVTWLHVCPAATNAA